jgi:hypothetical protein
MAVKLVSQSEYARMRDVSKMAVSKAVADGRITLIDGKIDPEVADIQWAKNTRARVDSGAGSKGVGQDLFGDDGAGQKPEQTKSDDDSYQAARRQREFAEASLAELRLAKELKNAIDRERSFQAIFTAFRSLRDSLMVIGRKSAPSLHSMSDARTVQLAVDAAIRDTLNAFVARTLPSLLLQLTGTAGHAVPGDLLAQPPADTDEAEGA